jgi:hypothetical protein
MLIMRKLETIIRYNFIKKQILFFFFAFLSWKNSRTACPGRGLRHTK